jgi:DNA-binding response OmpR family regulator
VDVVLSDLGLADGDGGALAGTLGANLPLVFMAGSPLRARELDASSVIIKPFDLGEARMRWRRLCRSGRVARAGRGRRTRRRRLAFYDLITAVQCSTDRRSLRLPAVVDGPDRK